ncbi:cell surface protein [Pelagibacterium montanilacus]|uniref:cell surface protein n=1 Tax=Pelagibacterium montanilacus TaxID=2185280 RepID=UPI000F8C36B8|nr:cell surface protein [Pelagibacterium montanilacus]
MTTALTQTPLTYLDRAVGAVKELGLWPETVEENPVSGLLDQIVGLDETRVVLIGRVLTQASVFNEVVRTQVAAMNIGERYEAITNDFSSIRDDARRLVDQLDDGKLDMLERASNVWMKVSRGDIPARFDRIRDAYLTVSGDTKDQIDREHAILEAYRDFRGALKQAEVMALEVLETATTALEEKRTELKASADTLAAFSGDTAAERARLEMERDEKLRALQNEERRYQIAKDLSDNLTVAYSTSEVIMTRLAQTTSAKERVYQQSISFFSTNETVLTALSASFTGMFGLHESTETLNAMKEGMSQSLETLADIGGKVQTEALKAGYGPTIRADAVKALVDSVVSYQEHSREIIAEMRTLATRESAAIREAVEDGKARLARLAAQSDSLAAQ